ncbi:hypothetical protein LSAT2_005673 [Lamellibrachia satsuma]|nr:hypothetical protein LSAT2_005673 [Lamellibrachia satsuma]
MRVGRSHPENNDQEPAIIMKTSMLALTIVALMCVFTSSDAWLIGNDKYKGCRGIPYLPDESICCDGSRYPRWDFNSCCGAKPYNKDKNICCNNRLYKREENSEC